MLRDLEPRLVREDAWTEMESGKGIHRALLDAGLFITEHWHGMEVGKRESMGLA